jgi:hypothetical protein
MVKKECVRFGGHVDIEVSFKMSCTYTSCQDNIVLIGESA